MAKRVSNARIELFLCRIYSTRALRLLLITAIGIAFVLPTLVHAQETITIQPAGRVTWDEMVRAEALKAAAPGSEPHVIIPYMPPPEPRETEPSPTPPSVPAEPVESRESEPTPLGPPSLGTGFEALPDNNTSIPPDTMGAAGPNHLMVMLNTQVRIQQKDGTNISTVSLDNFWTSGTGLSGDPFDPRLIYDSLSNRWMAVVDANSQSKDSAVWFAISDDSNAEGIWTYYEFEADTTDTYWADFPDIGVNNTWIAITNNMFRVSNNSSGGAKMWVIDKSTALDGGAITVTPFARGFDEAPPDSGYDGFALRPALTFDAGESTLYIVDRPGWTSGGIQVLRLSQITGTGSAPAWSVVPGDSWGGRGWFYVDNDFESSQIDADQLGTATDVETNDPRLLNAVLRNGRLWTTHSGGLPNGGPVDRTAVFWYELDPTALPTPIVQSGLIGGTDAGTHYFFPSIAVNANDDAVVGFSYSDATQYVEAAFTGRESTDEAGTMGAITTCKQGEDSYVKYFSGTRNRWGDYSATVVDPTDDLSFWTIQEYAETDVGDGVNDDRWGTWWCLVYWSPTSADLISFTAAQHGDKVGLKWKTGYEVDNLGFHVYRDVEGERMRVTPELLAGSALLAGQGTRLTAGRSYAWSDTPPPGTDLSRVKYWLEDVDLNGTRTWHGPIEVVLSAISPPLPAMHQESVVLSRLGRAADAQSTTVPSMQAASTATLPEPTGGLLKKQWNLAGQSCVKLHVQQEGWYRVTQPQLAAAGLSPDIDPQNLQVYADAEQQAIRVTGEEDGRFDAVDAVEFFAMGLDTPSTDTRVYWLVAGSKPGKRIESKTGHRLRQADPSFPFTVEKKDRTVYFSALKNGDEENFFGAVVTAQPLEQVLHLQHLDPLPPADAVLEIALQGVSAGPHRVSILLNSVHHAGEMDFEGQTRKVGWFPVPQEWLQNGANTVTLAAQEGETDVSLVDVIRLTYWHTYTAENNALRFTVPAQHQVTVKGFTSPQVRVMDVTDPEKVLEVIGNVRPDGPGFSANVKVPGKGDRILLSFAEDWIKEPAGIVLNDPSGWHEGHHEADLVIISHGAFVESVLPLKTLREGQERSVALINAEDLYDEFSFGAHSPRAFRDFLDRARARWQPAPRFVLLVGDASFDPRNYLGLGDFDLMPTKLVETAYFETASDDWFVDQNDDGLPELAVGRLPVRTAEEAAAVIAKIIEYEQSGTRGRENGALVVADENDDFDFEGASIDVEGLLPVDMPVTEIFRGQTDTATAKSELLSSLNQGPALVNYMGHGSVEVWRGNLLTSEDALALENGMSLPFVISMTCLNGFFHDLYTESLAEALLKAEDGGAVAVWTSSGLTYPAQQAVLNREIVRLLFSEESLTLGEAAVGAKAAVSDQDIRKTWILFGDPTTQIK